MKFKKEIIREKCVLWTPSAMLEYNPSTKTFKVIKVDEAYLAGEFVHFPERGSAYIKTPKE